ncbi:hypothetical protein [Pseudomonas sp. 31-12]|uniref:hypothetical protein n=1 Tax=Pseudomonas sp. 31-12 TaxID=2201356 RepID=UPI002113E766|nr:hypothetical protein [Pseudomonas sp. 31-12]
MTSIDDAILACHFEAILALQDGYAIWLQSGRQADNLVALIGNLKRQIFRSLTDTRLQIVRTLIRPGAGKNPFPGSLEPTRQ